MKRAALKYQAYVEPHAGCVGDLAGRFLGAQALEEVAQLVVDWTRRNIQPVELAAALCPVDDLLTLGRGPCFSIACLIVSVLRRIGISESYVGVLHLPDRLLDGAFHAVALARGPNEDWLLLDAVGDRSLISVGDLGHLPRELGEIVVMFNDEEAFIR